MSRLQWMVALFTGLSVACHASPGVSSSSDAGHPAPVVCAAPAIQHVTTARPTAARPMVAAPDGAGVLVLSERQVWRFDSTGNQVGTGIPQNDPVRSESVASSGTQIVACDDYGQCFPEGTSNVQLTQLNGTDPAIVFGHEKFVVAFRRADGVLLQELDPTGATTHEAVVTPLKSLDVEDVPHLVTTRSGYALAVRNSLLRFDSNLQPVGQAIDVEAPTVVAAAGDELGLILHRAGTDPGPWFQHVSADDKLTAPILVREEQNDTLGGWVSLAGFEGKGFAVLWGDKSGYPSRLYYRSVSTDGALLGSASVLVWNEARSGGAVSAAFPVDSGLLVLAGIGSDTLAPLEVFLLTCPAQ